MKVPAHNIYVHVPFCIAKCNYCAFFSRACENPDWGDYANKICAEIDFWGQKLGRIDVPTIFLGGGTPSLMPVAIFNQIIGAINKNFHILPNAEITLESNPKTLGRDKLRDFISMGVNRLSVGVQRLSDDELAWMGRRHNVQDAIELINVAQNAGIRVSADFIYGIPNDTPDSVAALCRKINELNLTHCSLYELTIEPSTPFGRQKLTMPSNDLMAQMYVAISETLNLPRYEVSNYAVAGHECVHNQNVWDGQPYIGIGQAAAGRILIDNQWYEQMGNGDTFVPITNQTRATEHVITGMRTIRGCRLTDDVKNVIDMDWVRNNPKMVQISENRIKTTSDGMLVLDSVIEQMVK